MLSNEQRDADWQEKRVDKAEQPIEHVCALTESNHVRDLEKRPVEFNLGTYWSEWPNRKAGIQLFVKADSKRHNIVIDTDASITKDQSGKQGEKSAHEDSGAYRNTTSSLAIKVEAVTHAMKQPDFQRDTQISDSMNLPHMVEFGMGSPE